jgi:hypothetical protein
MARHELLNNIDHRDLKVISDKSPKLGDNVMYALIYPFEFRAVQADYPIFFGKDATTGTFMPLAMFGLEKNENLFLNEQGWDADYIPVMIERGPFLIGYQHAVENNVPTKNLVISIDMDSPKLSTLQGQPIFLPHGGNTDYIEKMASMLQAISEGQTINEEFTKALVKYDLLESFVVDTELKNGSVNRLSGFYTINEQNLANLKSDALEELHSRHILEAIYMIVASLSNIKNLIARKNALL